MNNLELEDKKIIVKQIRENLTKILLVLFFATLAINLWMLTDLGTRGAEFSQIKAEETLLKDKIDVYRSELEALKVNSKIESNALDQLELQEKNIKVVKLSDTISADGR